MHATRHLHYFQIGPEVGDKFLTGNSIKVHAYKMIQLFKLLHGLIDAYGEWIPPPLRNDIYSLPTKPHHVTEIKF